MCVIIFGQHGKSTTHMWHIVLGVQKGLLLCQLLLEIELLVVVERLLAVSFIHFFEFGALILEPNLDYARI